MSKSDLFFNDSIVHAFKRFRLVKLMVLTITLLIISQTINAQEGKPAFNSFLCEVGLGYPITLTGQDQYTDAHINLGYRQLIKGGYIGFVPGFHFRGVNGSELSVNSKIRWSREITEKYDLSFDLGYSFYSTRFKEFPGFTFGVNLQNNKHYGIHLRYDEFSGNGLPTERNIVLGLHLTDRKAKKIGLPIFGVIAGLYGILQHIISQSK